MFCKTIDKVSDLPIGEHYVILENVSIQVPGDERSRTCPGHGYPAYTQQYMSLRIFTSKDSWEKEIKDRIGNPRSYPAHEWTAVIIKRPNIKTTIVFEMD